ncbi:MAG: DUF3592 domain-containing protein [Verrucomicrobiota bacterium]
MKNQSPQSTRSPSAHQLGGRIWKILMGLILIAAGSTFVAYLWGSYQRASIMDSWVETETTIESLEADDTQVNQRGMPKYILEVRYPYQFGGKDYLGTRIKRLPTEASDPRKLKGKIESYRAGTTTVCYVDPEDPEMAVLKKDTKAALYSIWFPCLFVIGGVGMIVSALFPKRLSLSR